MISNITNSIPCNSTYYSIIFINSDNEMSNTCPVNNIRINFDDSNNVLHSYELSFRDLDSFIKLVDDFEFILFFEENTFKGTYLKEMSVYKVSDFNHQITRSRSSNFKDDFDSSISFRVEKTFKDFTPQTKNELISELTRIRRELKLGELGI